MMLSALALIVVLSADSPSASVATVAQPATCGASTATTGTTNGNTFGVSAYEAATPCPPPPGQESDLILSSQPACDQAPCLFADVDCGDETPLFNSLSTPAGEVVKTWFSCPGDLDLGTVVTAFKQMTLDPGVLMIEPPDHVTLVNFDTNFYTTTTEPVSKSVVLLEQQVTIEAMPSAYDWTFGDGESLRTKIPGAPYPRLDITHNYLRKGDYLPALSTTYTGRFKVGDGAWQTIPGTVTIPGTGQPLRAIEAKPKLVGY